MGVAPFPWETLDAVGRADAARLRALSAALDDVAHPSGLPAALSSLLGIPVLLAAVRRSVAMPPGPPAVELERDDGALRLELGAEPALASRVAAQLLGRPPPVVDPRQPLPAPVRGALAALAVETARRLSVGPVLRPARGWRPPGAPLLFEARLSLDGRPYSAWVALFARELALPGSRRAGSRLPVTVPLVAAATWLPASALRRLAPGDGLLPDDWLSAPWSGRLERVAAVAPAAERGVDLHRRQEGWCVAGELALPWTMHEPPPEPTELDAPGAAALQAPVVVRVEVGQLTLSADEWLRLRPGDVLATGVRLGEGVTLRAGGRVVARGELVNVEGEVGVRLLDFSGGE